MVKSQLASECQKCPYVESCENKRMEMMAYLPLSEPIITGVDLAAGNDYSFEETLRLADAINTVGNPYPVSTAELNKAIELTMKESRYGLFGR